MKILYIANLFKIIQNCIVLQSFCLLLSNINATEQKSNDYWDYNVDSEIKKNNKKFVSLTYKILSNNMLINPLHFAIVGSNDTYIYNNNCVLSYSKNNKIDARTKPIYDNEIRNKFNKLFTIIEKSLKKEVHKVFGNDYNISTEKSNDIIWGNSKYFKNKKFLSGIQLNNFLFSKTIVFFNKNNTFLYLKTNNKCALAIFTSNKSELNYNTVPNNNKNANEHDPLLLQDNYNNYILNKFKVLNYNLLKNATSKVFANDVEITL